MLQRYIFLSELALFLLDHFYLKKLYIFVGKVVLVMRLLWFNIVLLVFLIVGSESSLMSQNVTGEVASEEKEQMVSAPTFLSSASRDWQEYIHLIRASVFIKAWDLPSDEFSDMSLLPGKVHHSMGGKTLPAGMERMISFRNYMQLLSARHIKGFYIYSLEKLII